MLLVWLALVFSQVSGQKQEKIWETKCHKTQVEEYIYEYNVRNLSLLYLPMLSRLKKMYPGDSFHLTKESACEDLDTDYCQYLAERGHCIGSDWKVQGGQYCGEMIKHSSFISAN